MPTLLINPVIKTQHYIYYFAVSRNTALKYLRIDLQAHNKKRLTYQDFFEMYGTFPDPQFRPKWSEMRNNAQK